MANSEKIISVHTTPLSVMVLTDKGRLFNLKAKKVFKDQKDVIEYSWEPLPELP